MARATSRSTGWLQWIDGRSMAWQINRRKARAGLRLQRPTSPARRIAIPYYHPGTLTSSDHNRDCYTLPSSSTLIFNWSLQSLYPYVQLPRTPRILHSLFDRYTWDRVKSFSKLNIPPFTNIEIEEEDRISSKRESYSAPSHKVFKPEPEPHLIPCRIVSKIVSPTLT